MTDDYQEACLAVEFSKKVAAALSRRCLSEMLQDFWQVQPGSLSDEFRQIKGTTNPLTWEAIESIRRSGMIGARLENEGAKILDTEPGEAKLLIGLIATLIEDGSFPGKIGEDDYRRSDRSLARASLRKRRITDGACSTDCDDLFCPIESARDYNEGVVLKEVLRTG